MEQGVKPEAVPLTVLAGRESFTLEAILGWVHSTRCVAARCRGRLSAQELEGQVGDRVGQIDATVVVEVERVEARRREGSGELVEEVRQGVANVDGSVAAASSDVDDFPIAAAAAAANATAASVSIIEVFAVSSAEAVEPSLLGCCAAAPPLLAP